MKKKKRRFSVKHKLMTMSMVTSVTAVILTCVLFVFYLAYVAKDSLEKELYLISNIMGNRIASSISSKDNTLAQNSIDELNIKNSVIIACVYDSGGEVFASYFKKSNSKCPTKPAKGSSSEGLNTLWVHKDIIAEENSVGSLYIESDLREVREKIPQYMLFAMLLTCVVMCLVYYMSAIFQRMITEPIISLVKTAHNVIKEDDYKVRVVKYDNDEIGDLTGAFNKLMLQVRKERENLEMNVFERTQQLEEEKIKAEAVNKAKSEFLRNMSHEFRTPLHGMLSFSTYGINEAQTAQREDLHRYFSRINQVANRLLKLVEAILSIAQIESGKELLQIEENDLLKTIKSAIREQQALLKEREITLNLQEPNISTVADFDRDKMMQVVINILGNSIKFTPNGKEISIYFGEKMFTRDRRRKESPAITISIADQGIGIPEDELETIFEKFVQSSRTDTGAGGTGLGLAIASGIVKMHDGIIDAHNNESGGAVFTVTIPRESRRKEA
jgi:signal transduction histidine kinase